MLKYYTLFKVRKNGAKQYVCSIEARSKRQALMFYRQRLDEQGIYREPVLDDDWDKIEGFA